MEIPAELMTSVDRKERIRERQGRLGKEWLKYAVIEFFVLAPGVASLVLLVNRETAGSVIAAMAVVLVLPMAALVLYWVKYRIGPLQREIDELRRLEDEPVGPGARL